MSGPSRISREQWAEAAAQYEAGRKPREIVAKLGVSIGAFNWNMLQEGASPPKAKKLPQRAPGPEIVQRSGHVVRHFTAEEDARILELSLEGKNVTDIARAIGRRWNSTRGRLMTLARHDDRNEATT